MRARTWRRWRGEVYALRIREPDWYEHRMLKATART
jgi:hypothetical protein